MQIKDRVIIKIESIAFGGEGVSRIDNFVVFVPFAAPGDELEIEITQQKKKFARGRILKIIKPSPARVKPLCRYYENCGGCCYQHLKYEYQLEIKKNQVAEAFWKIGKMKSTPVLKTIAAPNIFYYRGKAQYHAEAVSNGWKIGFLDVSGGKLVDIERCEIMEETINEKMCVLRENKQLRLNTNARLTIWSDFFVDQASGTPPAGAGGSFPKRDIPRLAENIQPPAGAGGFLQRGKKESIVRVVKEKIFLAPRDGFFQANLYLTDQLVDEICRLAAADEINTLVDAYCGSGLFSIFLAPYAENVIGIEINEKSVKHARINAENTGVKNVKFIHGDIKNVLQKKILPSGEEISVIVLDPPRSGCEKEVLKAIVDLQPQKIIYVSCNPATQARDVKYLNERGYNLQSLLPVDMFPQTEHIEVVGLMSRR